MKKGLATIVALVLLGTISLSAFAYGDGWGRSGNQMGSPRLLLKDLNLSPEQQQKLLIIRQDYQKDTQTLRFEMQKKQLELRQLWSAQALNRNEIEAKEKEVASLRVQLVTKVRAMQEKMKGVLTPEQLKKFEEDVKNCNPGAGPGRRPGRVRRGGFFGA